MYLRGILVLTISFLAILVLHLNVDELLNQYPYVKPKGTGFFENLPEALQEQILEHRKSKLENNAIQWRGYMDCPFIPKAMVSEYRTLTSGWYHMMYRIMVATACNAVKQKYPLTEKELAQLCRQLDQDTGNWYENRPLEVEANSAIKMGVHERLFGMRKLTWHQ